MSDRTWRQAFRQGVCPLMPSRILERLADALERDSPTLCQRCTTYPPALHGLRSRACEEACLIGWCGWHHYAMRTVDEVDQWFYGVLTHIDCTVGPG